MIQMLKTHEIVYDTNIKSNRQPKLEKKNVAANENFILGKMD